MRHHRRLRRRGTRALLRICFGGLLLILSSCAVNAHLPAWHGKIYQADRQASVGPDGITHPGLVRRQANEVIAADDPSFNQFMAMTWGDFRAFTETFVFSCQHWNEDAPLSMQEVQRFLKSLRTKGSVP